MPSPPKPLFSAELAKFYSDRKATVCGCDCEFCIKIARYMTCRACGCTALVAPPKNDQPNPCDAAHCPGCGALLIG